MPDLDWTIAGVGDFNGDGKADILWRNTNTGQNAIWLMNGTTLTSGGHPRRGTDLGWQIVGVGDFNGDGKADILWRNAPPGQNAIWLMNGTTLHAARTPAADPDLAGDSGRRGLQRRRQGRHPVAQHTENFCWRTGRRLASSGSAGSPAPCVQICALISMVARTPFVCNILSQHNMRAYERPFRARETRAIYPLDGALLPFGGRITPPMSPEMGLSVLFAHSGTAGFGEKTSASDPGGTTTLLHPTPVTGYARPIVYQCLGRRGGELHLLRRIPARSGTCGHYTQLVWRNTTEVGCAYSGVP